VDTVGDMMKNKHLTLHHPFHYAVQPYTVDARFCAYQSSFIPVVIGSRYNRFTTVSTVCSFNVLCRAEIMIIILLSCQCSAAMRKDIRYKGFFSDFLGMVDGSTEEKFPYTIPDDKVCCNVSATKTPSVLPVMSQ
jgi:hypothetical protein